MGITLGNPWIMFQMQQISLLPSMQDTLTLHQTRQIAALRDVDLEGGDVVLRHGPAPN